MKISCWNEFVLRKVDENLDFFFRVARKRRKISAIVSIELVRVKKNSSTENRQAGTKTSIFRLTRTIKVCYFNSNTDLCTHHEMFSSDENISIGWRMKMTRIRWVRLHLGFKRDLSREETHPLSHSLQFCQRTRKPIKTFTQKIEIDFLRNVSSYQNKFSHCTNQSFASAYEPEDHRTRTNGKSRSDNIPSMKYQIEFYGNSLFTNSRRIDSKD